MELKRIVEEIKAERPRVTSIISIGCGTSQAGLYPAKYFLEGSAKGLRTGLYTVNELVHATSTCVGEENIITTCSLGGNTSEAVEASKKAMNMGAKIIAITYTLGSPLVSSAHYVVLHGFEKNYAAKLEKMTFCPQLAAKIPGQYEGYEHYQDMMIGPAKIFDLIENAVSSIVPSAKKFAENYEDAPVIYATSSGATHMVAYSFFIYLLIEIQWISSGSFHDGEFFHSPLEIVGKDAPFLFLIDDDDTRALDSRALDLLNRSQAKITLVDVKDFELRPVVPSTVKDYLNPMLITAVLRVYAERLTIFRNHPLTQRRYVWKLKY